MQFDTTPCLLSSHLDLLSFDWYKFSCDVVTHAHMGLSPPGLAPACRPHPPLQTANTSSFVNSLWAYFVSSPTCTCHLPPPTIFQSHRYHPHLSPPILVSHRSLFLLVLLPLAIIHLHPSLIDLLFLSSCLCIYGLWHCPCCFGVQSHLNCLGPGAFVIICFSIRISSSSLSYLFSPAPFPCRWHRNPISDFDWPCCKYWHMYPILRTIWWIAVFVYSCMCQTRMLRKGPILIFYDDVYFIGLLLDRGGKETINHTDNIMVITVVTSWAERCKTT